MTQKIITNLWFDDQAEEAVAFYTSLFKDSRVVSIARYTEAGPGEPGSVMTVEFELAGQRFVAINGGPMFPFTEAMSLQIDCEDQAEIDYFWNALTADGGAESQCGWCKDRWGMNWQVVPKGMEEFFNGSDPARTERAVRAMFTMRKIDVAAMQAAADGDV
jgi:predicted 3-demethylubiquinone-9 3-methyltransferase (glyoxalase superfamily)